MNSESDATVPLFCDRCTTELHPGRGDFYVVKIEAFADPSPPIVEEKDATGIRQEIERLLAGMEGVSATEAMEQVYRRVGLYLCGTCYREWIERPVGE